MRYLILFLVLLNVVVFLLPKASQRTMHSYTRGEATEPLLVRLDEQEEPPTKTSLVAPAVLQVAVEVPSEQAVSAPAVDEPVPEPETAAQADEENNDEPGDSSTTEASEESTGADDEDNALAAIKSQGTFDKATGGNGTEGIVAVEPPTSGAIARGPLQCFTLGPFKDRKEANALMALMVKKGVKPALRTAKSREPSAYWVYLPPYPSRERAVEAVDRLEALGFDDYFIVGDPKYNNAISLGLFSRKAGSKQRVRDMKEMGFDAKVEPRYAEREVFWIDYSSHGEIDWHPLLKKYKDSGNIKNKARDCE